MLDFFINICVDCLSEHKTWFLLSAFIVLFLWCIRGISVTHKADPIDGSLLPQPAADFPGCVLGYLERTVLSEIQTRLASVIDDAHKILNLFHVLTLFGLVSWLVKFMTWFYRQNGNGWDYLRAFKTSLIFYLVVIPLPAAFLPPVGHVQTDPDVHLLIATLLLILVNAVGDMVSVKITIWNYRHAMNMAVHMGIARNAYGKQNKLTFSSGVREELIFYGMTVLDLFFASLSLIGVLMISNILFGVQIGQYKFTADMESLGMMWDQATSFWVLRHELYWFRGDEDGFMGYPGIPGMLIFGITTYLPTILVGLAAIVWTLALPIRIIFGKTMGSIARLTTSQFVVFTYCMFVVMLSSLDFKELYGFLITK